MTIVMYERVGFEQRRPSPFSWRIRYALAHKGVPVEFRLVDPLERTLAEQPYFSGAARTYTNYLLFSVFQYARLGCPDEFLAEGTALRRWRDDLASAFDGLGNRYLSYPASLA